MGGRREMGGGDGGGSGVTFVWKKSISGQNVPVKSMETRQGMKACKKATLLQNNGRKEGQENEGSLLAFFLPFFDTGVVLLNIFTPALRPCFFSVHPYLKRI